MLKLWQQMRETQADMLNELGDSWSGHPRGPPIVVHCSAGIGRTGAFIALDISILRLEDVGTVDLRATVLKLRKFRTLMVGMPSQYAFCHRALIEYALDRKLLSFDINLEELDDNEAIDRKHRVIVDDYIRRAAMKVNSNL